MDEPKAWFHVVFSTHGAWMRGDARGFRDPGKRVFSTGDYKSPPPPKEHEGLRAWSRANLNGPVVHLDEEHRARAGFALVEKLLSSGAEVLVVAVGADHVHILAKLPEHAAEKVIGNAKRFASHQLRNVYPGRMWGRRARCDRIKGREHQLATYRYILKHRFEGCWVWTFKEPPPSATIRKASSSA